MYAPRRKYGNRLCVIGNVSVDTLARGTPQQVERETAGLLRDLQPLGGYIISSSNMLTDYTAPENFLAMSRCIKSYVAYACSGIGYNDDII